MNLRRFEGLTDMLTNEEYIPRKYKIQRNLRKEGREISSMISLIFNNSVEYQYCFLVISDQLPVYQCFERF